MCKQSKTSGNLITPVLLEHFICFLMHFRITEYSVSAAAWPTAAVSVHCLRKRRPNSEYAVDKACVRIICPYWDGNGPAHFFVFHFASHAEQPPRHSKAECHRSRCKSQSPALTPGPHSVMEETLIESLNNSSPSCAS